MEEDKKELVYVPTQDDTTALETVFKEFMKARNVTQRQYNQFNGRSLYECIDDWTKRWNGYIPAGDPLLSSDSSRIFLNFTRNAIIAYLAKVAMQPPTAVVKAINKKTGLESQKLGETMVDLLKYSSNEENGPQKFLRAELERVTKGTVVTYEGYLRSTHKMKVPVSFDAETGKAKFKTEKRVVFDNCFQRVVPLEDFFIANAYEPDVQKQPYIFWKELTSYSEAKLEFGGYENFKYVQPGAYAQLSQPTTFYREAINSEMTEDQVEIIRYYNRSENQHTIVINGVICYDGPIPFKDGKYPFAKAVFEPYDNFFFWGAGFAQKVMGDQDLINTLWNMMVDKTEGSLMPYGLSSDLDDLIDDDILLPNKIRKVGDINKWKFDNLPGITAGEQSMLQMAINFVQQNSGDLAGAGQASANNGGKVTARQVLLRHQDAMQKLGFSMNFSEDYERDRTELRLSHILQFYSIPKIEKITGKNGKEIETLLYRDIKLTDAKLEGGEKGNKIIQLTDNDTISNPDKKKKFEDNLAVLEAMGEETGVPTVALGLSVDVFYDYNLMVTIQKNSSFEKNQALDQASRMEYANWRFGIAPIVPGNFPAIVKWVDESYDVPSEEFQAPEPPPQPQMPPGMEQGMPPPQGGPAQAMAPSNMPLAEMPL